MARGMAALAMLLPVVMTALVPGVVATRPLSLDRKNATLLWTQHNIPPDGSWTNGRATWYTSFPWIHDCSLCLDRVLIPMTGTAARPLTLRSSEAAASMGS
jgi:hypothetical protein